MCFGELESELKLRFAIVMPLEQHPSPKCCHTITGALGNQPSSIGFRSAANSMLPCASLKHIQVIVSYLHL